MNRSELPREEEWGGEVPPRPGIDQGRSESDAMTQAEERTGYRSGDPDFRAASFPSASDAPRRQFGEAPELCDRCGAPLLDRHCRLVCLACGFQRDCSDP